MAATMTGLVGAMKTHSKRNHANEKKTDVPAEPVPVGAKLEPSMVTLADAFRLNERTRAALEEYDATTLEDLAYMTNHDYEGMLASAARRNRPLCPLQQRKVAVLMYWVRNLVKDSSPFKERPKKKHEANFFDRVMHHSPSEWRKVNPLSHDDEDSKTVDTGTVIPPDWEARFEEDLPMLKKKLKEIGDTSSFSLYSDVFINIRWIICGYQH